MSTRDYQNYCRRLLIRFYFSAGRENRTPNLLITNQLLCLIELCQQKFDEFVCAKVSTAPFTRLRIHRFVIYITNGFHLLTLT